MSTDKLFVRADKKALESLDREIADVNSQIETLQNKIPALEAKRKELEKEYFYGYEIIREDTTPRMHGESYSLAVNVAESFRIEARVYPNAHDGGRTFVANLAEWGVNWHTPKWFKSDIKFGLGSLEEAKEVALERLVESLKIADAKKYETQEMSK